MGARLNRKITMEIETITLYRPTGSEELELVSQRCEVLSPNDDTLNKAITFDDKRIDRSDSH